VKFQKGEKTAIKATNIVEAIEAIEEKKSRNIIDNNY